MLKTSMFLMKEPCRVAAREIASVCLPALLPPTLTGVDDELYVLKYSFVHISKTL